MATLTLAGLYLARTDDLATILHLNSGVALSQDGGVRARTSIGANGRARLIKRPGRNVQLAVTASRISRDKRELLEEWEAEELLLRDGRGRAAFGFYSEPRFTEQPGLPFCSLALTFSGLTVDVFAA